MKAFNSNRLLQIAGGDIKQARVFVDSFLTESYRKLGEVKHAIDEHDCPATARAVNSLRGTLASAGADRAADIASSLERMSRFEMLAAADSFYPLLHEAIDDFEQYATRLVDHKWWHEKSDTPPQHTNLLMESQ